MARDRHVHDAAPFVRQDDQHEEESTCGGRHDEEVGRRDLPDMICETRATSARAVVGAGACILPPWPD
jgi:hypothetical protein